MEKIVIKGRRVVGGHTEGEALVSSGGIGCFGSLDPKTGIITERRHCIQGACIKDKILVFPCAKGSSAWSGDFFMLRINGVAPRGMLISHVECRSALGAVMCQAPTVTDFDLDPLEVIETGDWVEINADEGLIYVTKKQGG